MRLCVWARPRLLHDRKKGALVENRTCVRALNRKLYKVLLYEDIALDPPIRVAWVQFGTMRKYCGFR